MVLLTPSAATIGLATVGAQLAKDTIDKLLPALGELYFGIIGIAGHSLVPLGLWLGVPTFVDLAASDPGAAAAAWSGYAGFQAAAGAVGALFLGLSTLAAGSAIISQRGWPVLLGWLGVLTGAASALTVLAAETPLSALAAAAYLPSLTLAIVFRIWAGIALWRGDAQPALDRGRPSDPTAATGSG